MATWKPTPNGYELVDGPCPATLTRVGRKWRLDVDGHGSRMLGRRASFDHAESAIVDMIAE